MDTFFANLFSTPPPNIVKDTVASVPPIKISEVSQSFREYFLIIKQMDEDLKHLEKCYNDMDADSWTYWRDRVNSLRDQSLALKQSLKLKLASQPHLKRQINKRKKKRRKQQQRNIKLTPSKYEISALHRQQLQQRADQKKQEEKLKSEADSILSSVRQKKTEAKHRIRLLTALQKLHSARIRDSSFSNKLSSCSDSFNGFVRIIDKLTLLWDKHMKEYIFEEKGLNIMIKHSTFNDSENDRDCDPDFNDESCTHLKRNFVKWLKLMFGTGDLQKGLYYSDVQDFVQIRQEWDKFVCNSELSNASKIPFGWIVPKGHCDDSWSHLRSTDK